MIDEQELKTKANLHINAKIVGLLQEIGKLKNEKPCMALTQDMIDNVLRLKKEQLATLNYIKLKLK